MKTLSKSMPIISCFGILTGITCFAMPNADFNLETLGREFSQATPLDPESHRDRAYTGRCLDSFYGSRINKHFAALAIFKERQGGIGFHSEWRFGESAYYDSFRNLTEAEELTRAPRNYPHLEKRGKDWLAKDEIWFSGSPRDSEAETVIRETDKFIITEQVNGAVFRCYFFKP